MTPMLDAALHYCRNGLRVFPLEPGGKAPIAGFPGGWHSASADEAVTRARFTQWPTANLGVAVPPEYVVVDVDIRHGGHYTLEALEAKYGALPSTLTARTGGGGRHLWFRKPPGLKLKKSLGKGIDLISGTGYATVAPSFVQRAYVWEDVEQFDPSEIAELPAWLAEVAKVVPDETPASVENSSGYIDARQIEEVTSALAHLPADDYQTWVNVGMALHSTGAQEALEMWLQWSQRSTKYEHKAALDKWRSFGRNGKGGITLRSIFQWAQEAGWQNPLKGSAPMQGNVVQFPMAPVAPIERVDISKLGEQKPPPRSWLIDQWMPSRQVTVMHADGGLGKTRMALQIAMMVCCGRELMGLKPNKSGPVAFLSAEEDAESLRIIVHEIAHGLRLTADDMRLVRERLHLIDLTENEALLYGEHGLTPRGAALLNYVREHGCVLNIIDNVSACYGGPPTEQQHVYGFVHAVRASILPTGGAALLLMHENKAALTQGNRTHAYGGIVAWSNSVRSRIEMTGDKEDSDARIIKLPKNNYLPLGREPVVLRWFEGAFVPPIVDAFMERLRANGDVRSVVQAVERLIGMGQRVPAKKNAPSNALKLADHMGIKLGMPAERFWNAFGRSIESGYLRVETYRGSNRSEAQHVVLGVPLEA